MIPTKSYIEQKFDEFNRQMFGGQLPRIPVVLSDAKSFLGKCTYKIRRRQDGKAEYYDYKLRINTRADLPEREVEDTIIHEMIHYYIGLNRIEDISSHGPVFMQIMNAINKKFGRNITVSFKSTDKQREQFVDKKPRYHVVAVVRLKNGKTGIKVLPKIVERILNYYYNISRASEVTSVELYMTNDIFFNRFPNSAVLKAHEVDEKELFSHLNGAEKMECDGKRIIRNVKR